jgi:hypothetical protein
MFSKGTEDMTFSKGTEDMTFFNKLCLAKHLINDKTTKNSYFSKGTEGKQRGISFSRSVVS